ncbi:hypothetical protein [Pseudophaeobacter sp.]|uniref:hypothetical protein n=1 Tax=Pseudophaeobacter sp. TaxID=1971739 RepID=UPI0032993B74
MLNSTLYILNSGFGDMLKQINIFFHLSDVYSFNPKVFIRQNNKRNTLKSHIFFDEIGFSSIIGPRPQTCVEEAASLSEISAEITEAYKFDASSYNNPGLEELVGGRDREIHPKLRALATQSNLCAEIVKRRDTTNRIALHVRRGDVAQINGDDFPSVFDIPAVAGRILHCRGLFHKETLCDELSYGNRRRFADTSTHLDTLNRLKEREGVDSHVLVSDGFTKISRQLVGMHPKLLLDSTLSVEALEAALVNELRPLMVGASQTVIGESNSTFYDTIFTALACRVVISQSAGFLMELSKLFELDIEFVTPELRPVLDPLSVDPD